MLPLAEYNRLVQQMEADKNEGGAEADKLVTRWADLPPNWTCPDCGATKSDFEMEPM